MILGREMWAYTGDANSTATQMISNIRTVRAFSQEPREMVKYDESISEALAKGIFFDFFDFFLSHGR